MGTDRLFQSDHVVSESSWKLCTSVFPNRAASNLVNQHAFKRYLSVSVGSQSSEVMHLSVKRFHSWAKSLSTKFKQGEGTRYINKAINLDRRALVLCPLGHPERPGSLFWLGLHLGYRYNQLGEIGTLKRPLSLTEKPSAFACVVTLIGQCF